MTNDYNEKMEAATKRMDAIEMESKKTLSGVNSKTFKGQIESAIKDGAIDALIKGNTNAARFEIKAGDMTMANAYTGVVAGETVISDFKFDPSRSVHIRTLLPIGNTDSQTIRFPKESAYDDGAAFITSGGAFDDAVESANEFDVLIAALNQLALSNYQADTILLNPTDFHKIVLLKSTANEYLKNQIIQGIQPAINGVPITLNTAVTAGKFLVGNLAQASQLWVRDGLGIEFSREDSTNFRDGFVTVRAQERVALTNYSPNAIVQGTFSTAKAALETP